MGLVCNPRQFQLIHSIYAQLEHNRVDEHFNQEYWIAFHKFHSSIEGTFISRGFPGSKEEECLVLTKEACVALRKYFSESDQIVTELDELFQSL